MYVSLFMVSDPKMESEERRGDDEIDDELL